MDHSCVEHIYIYTHTHKNHDALSLMERQNKFEGVAFKRNYSDVVGAVNLSIQ